MPRDHGRVLARIWSDPDFCGLAGLTDDAQRLYMLLISQPTVNNAGVLPLTIRRWANRSRVPDPPAVEAALAELEGAHFVVVDHETEEVLVRSFIRNDGVAKQPKVLKNACGVAVQVESRPIREQLAVELRRVGTDVATSTADVLDPGRNASPLRLSTSPPEPYPEDGETLPDGHTEPNSVGNGVGEGAGVDPEGSPFVVGDVPSETASNSDEDAVADDREDVEALCRHLADRVEANGSKRPRITKTWRREARLLLDRDGRDLAKTHNLIDWCQDHHHWKGRVMAMPKFRGEYDAMRLQALEDHKRQRGQRPTPRVSASDAAAAQAQSLRRTPRTQVATPAQPEQPQLRIAEGF